LEICLLALTTREADFGTYLPVVILAIISFTFAVICYLGPPDFGPAHKVNRDKAVIVATTGSAKSTGTDQKDVIDASPDKNVSNGTNAGGSKPCQACADRKISTAPPQKSVLDDRLSNGQVWAALHGHVRGDLLRMGMSFLRFHACNRLRTEESVLGFWLSHFCGHCNAHSDNTK